MKRNYRILIICATSIATSTAIALRLEEVFKKEGLSVEITQGKGGDYISQSKNLHEEFDLVVPTVEFPKKTKIPVVSGVPFITGIGEDQSIQKILEILKSKKGDQKDK